MKRHHYIGAGAVAVGALAVLLWPQHTEVPDHSAPSSTDDPLLRSDAPRGADVPQVAPTQTPIVQPDSRRIGDGGVAAVHPLTANPGTDEPAARDSAFGAAGTSEAGAIDGGAGTKAPAPVRHPQMVAYRQGIKDAINRIKPSVADCYKSALRQDPSMAGTIRLTFEIHSVDGGGRVVSGEVPESEVRAPFFEACVLEKVGGAHFPEPLDGGILRVTYPFHFDPGGGWGGEPDRK